MGRLKKYSRKPLTAVVAVAAFILIGEMLIFLAFEGIHRYLLTDFSLPEVKALFEFADPILLVVIVSPALYLLIFRPMRAQLADVELQKERLNLAFVTANQSWFDLNIQTGEVQIGTEYVHMLGFEPDLFQTTFQNWIVNIHPDDRADTLAEFNDSVVSNETFLAEYRRLSQSGEWIWIHTIGKVVEWDKRQQPTRMVGIHGNITARKQAEEKIHYQAFYDELTQLPNRRLFMDRLQQAYLSTGRIDRTNALLFIDLDNFKTLNDTLGHYIGDLLLQQVAQRLESCVRNGDTVARLGGDEFMVLLENLSGQPMEASAQTEIVSEKILAAISQPYVLDSHEYNCTASIGATLFNGRSLAPEELMKQADIAMYQAKKAGRNTAHFFDEKMQEITTLRFSLEGELRKALDHHQFHLYYQLQVDFSNRPIGAETLIRWNHPLRGIVSPAQFIPLAEETGLILPIGHWVLEGACAQIKAWEQDPLTRDLVLAVNVSAKQFRQFDFVYQVEDAVQRHAINPKRLKLELTEGMLLDNIEDTIATMNLLSEFGVQLSLDDFGTGYSSLQYFKRLPLDQLKIDQSFVRDLATSKSDKAIVRTIISMAHGMEIDVIAEGVETEAQRQLLLKMGCIHYQGFLISKPLPIEQFEDLLNRSLSVSL
jgi:diguanylate cyclase (GGDEF)-like protein